ncbi:PREDICTED: short-chain dehydrogenase/reductase family 42E member 1 isoform X3 [Hipposideros armiger]|uniref:Short-chain dehydrogenase/reductase family 42E member 1 isoform X3 n=1 Tax=Hipposideros armiger TaxID=186990 RepID=A0A8B7QQD1_HIPAR|nr:PREDICTED: short-chain dehydrogenase/reductase family 42E member 1 isoform X3 [Hipposideros armiger]
MDSQKSPKESVLITGGGGYFGFRLGCALNQKGVHVILFDISSPAQTMPEGIKFIHGDIRHLSDIERAFQDVDVTCVFHIASYEKRVLEANGTSLERSDGVLRTCALRSAGIYGPGEQRHLPRIVSYIEKGLFKFVYGDPRSLVEFVHVDNLVQAHILASEALKADRGHIASGQPYFISDGRPVNNFEFFRPLVEGLGYPFPSIRLPLTLIYCFAFLTEMAHFLLGRLYNFQPFLTRTEVYKTGVTHYFSLEKAKKELGYEPRPFDLQEVVEWFKAHGHGRRPGSHDSECLARDGLLVFLLVMAVLTWLSSVILSL